MNLSNYKHYVRHDFFSNGEGKPVRYCAVCGKLDKRAKPMDLCKGCLKKYCPKGEKPVWIRELIRIESHNQRYVEPREISNSDLSNKEIGFDFLEDRKFSNPVMIENSYEGVISGRQGKVTRQRGAE